MPINENDAMYLVVPGYVVSKFDKQKHRIGIRQLVKLYGIKRGEYVTSMMGINNKIPILSPRKDGNYRCKRCGCPNPTNMNHRCDDDRGVFGYEY